MNELIEKIYGEACLTAGNLDEREFCERFAQLIVKEYEKLLPEICPWVDADKEGPMYGWHVQFVARKHFGITE